MRPEPPRLALRLLERLVAPELREDYVGDLVELFHRDWLPRLGPAAARRRVWRDALRALVDLRWRERPFAPPVHSGDPSAMTLLSDLRHGARLLRRAPTFTLLCVLTLALAIGGTTTIFSVVNPVLLRALPFPHPERLVVVDEREADGTSSNTSFATYRDLLRDARTLEQAALVANWQPTVTGATSAERVVGQRVSWSYFRTLGVRPALGRDFTADQDVPGRQRVVLLGDALWRGHFGADSTIVGHTISLDGVAHVVAGVLPASFENVVDPEAQIYRVLGYGPEQPWACRTCRHLRMLARLRPGVSPEAATVELDRLSAALVRSHPTDYPAAGVRITRLKDSVTSAARPALLAMFGAVCLVLLIAAANVASLQVARGLRRADELAIRTALGARRSRVARQLVVEGVLLAMIGGALGFVLASVALPLLRARLPETLPRLADVRLDPASLGVLVALTLALGTLVGLVPLWRGRPEGLAATLRGGAKLTGPRRAAARTVLVAAEVALALMLLTGAGLLTRTLVSLMSVQVGFDPTRLLTMRVNAAGPRYADDAAVHDNHDRLRAAVAALPGVEAVAIASQLPLSGNVDGYGVRAFDRPLANPALAPSADRYAVSADFLRAMRIPVLRGRPFTDADDRAAAPAVVIVSAALAGRIWPGEEALGKRVQMGDTTTPWRTVVGIAANVRHGGLDATTTQQVYVPARQWLFADNEATLVVRATGDPAALAPSVRRAVLAVDPVQPITHLATMDQLIATSTAQRRLARTLFVAFAGMALLLAAAGIYGVLAGLVAARAREIGLRTALGAAPADVVRLVLAEGARLTAVGVACGLVGAVALGRLLRTLLYGVSATDPLTLGAVAALLAVVALGACLAPMRRALRIAPMTALRDVP